MKTKFQIGNLIVRKNAGKKSYYEYKVVDIDTDIKGFIFYTVLRTEDDVETRWHQGYIEQYYMLDKQSLRSKTLEELGI